MNDDCSVAFCLGSQFARYPVEAVVARAPAPRAIAYAPEVAVEHGGDVDA